MATINLPKMNFRQQVTILAISISTFPVLAIGGFSYRIAARALMQETEALQQAVASDLQYQVHTFMEDRRRDIEVMASMPSLTRAELREQLSPAEKSQLLEQLMEQLKVYDSIAIFDIKGDVIAQTAGDPLGNHFNRSYIQAALKSRGAVISQPSISVSSERFSVYSASAIRDAKSQELIGFIRARMPVERLHQITQNYTGKNIDYYLITPRGEVFLDANGYYSTSVLSDGRRATSKLRIEEVFSSTKNLLNQKKSVALIAVNDRTNEKELLIYTPSLSFNGQQDLGWQTVIAQDYHLVSTSQRQLSYVLLAGTGLTALLVGAIAVYLATKVTKPVISAAKTVDEMGEGQLDARVEIDGPRELKQLGNSINIMAQKIQQLLVERTEKSVALRTAFNQLEIRSQELEQEVKERQQAEEALRQSQAKLVQTEKMSSLGQLVAGVAHEINNPVNFIYGNIAHAQRYMHDLMNLLALYQAEYPNASPEITVEIEEIDLDFLKEDLVNLLGSMKIGAERIREIVKSLRTFSRLDEAEFKSANIHEGLDSTLLILQNRLKAKPEHPEIQVIKEYAELPSIECYPGQLNQVFMNVLSNAIDALDDYNSKRSQEAIKEEPSLIKIRTEVLDSQRVAIHICDNGPGISEKVQSKLFDPFFTTKAVGQGTGLGLSISHQIIAEKHGGQLQCFSRVGEGTEFVIEIPILQTVKALCA